ncbi:L-type lectin-domain containing receptor kinase VIII.2 [Senna tora]|uniref:L-type lectin-domain containing receptor kinase VIII.2 n=1 Tax=Senna tora TaxID=362788 RepID=A0A834XHC7_9FABA|nr:L-type lectin-domain containing receptor kinase VIII.2 [Senna tora]
MLLVFFFLPQTLFADPISSFSFMDFEHDPQFDSNMALYGNAKVVNGGSAIRFSGTGRVMYNKPLKLVEGKLRQLISFSTYFAFSMSLENDDGLAFDMAFDNSNNSFSGVSSGLGNGSFLVVAFEVSTSRDGNGGEGNSVVAKINNTTSSVKMGLKKSGEKVKLHAWIDYEASSKRLEVRLSQYGNSRPSDPLLWHSILVSNMKEKKEMLVGFSTVKENTSEACFLYSWSFRSRQFPHWIHSEPMDPNAIGQNTEEHLRVKPKCDCFHRAFTAMLFGAGIGAIIGIVALYFSTMFGNREPVVPECVVDFEYKKVNIVVEKGTTEGGIKK